MTNSSSVAGVTVTATGGWPGTDPVEAMTAIRGELGSPHLPFLPELPGRGVGSDAVGRTASLLVELPVELAPHGWRLADGPGRELRQAQSTLISDVNVLADVAGSEESPAMGLQLQILGPLSLMAGLSLRSGERALSDHGARRDIAQSLSAGVGELLARVRGAVPGAALSVQVAEPDAAAVLGGLLPTVSGFRTLRSIPAGEVRAVWTVLVEALREAGATEVILGLDAGESPLEQAFSSGVDGIALPGDRLSVRQWEVLASAIEGGRSLWLGALPLGGTPVPDAERRSSERSQRPTSELAESVLRPWQQLGLPFSALSAVRLTPLGALSTHTPGEATRSLSRLVRLGDAVNEIAFG